MAEIKLPVLRNNGTVEENLNDNALYNVLPSRYTSKGEQATEVFDRVAKNIALGDLPYVEEDIFLSPDCIKPDHPRREELFEKADIDSNVTAFQVTEKNVRFLDYDAVQENLSGEVSENLESRYNEFLEFMEKLQFMPNTPTLINAGDELQQLSACIAGNVPVYTSEGLKDMKDVEVGDYVLTHKNRFKRVLSHEQTGVKDTMFMSSGTHRQKSYTLEATPDHEVFTGDGWEELEHIESPEKPSFDMDVRVPSEFRLTQYDNRLSRQLVADGGVVKALNKVPDRTGVYNDTMLSPKTRIDNDEKLAYLLGAYISEGNVNGVGGVRFTLNREDNYEIAKIGKYLRDVFGLDPKIGYRKQSGECTTISLGSKIVSNFFEEVCGRTFDVKSIPDFVANTTEEYKREFLSGLNLDGRQTTDNWSFQFANPTLTYEVLMLGRSLGYDGTFNYRAENKLSKNRTATCRFGEGSRLGNTVKKEGKKDVPVYDMSVEDDHSYLAGDYFVHNCFVISPDDDIYDIHDTARKAAEVFQSGGGMGYGFWTLRPRGSEVGSTGGYASGPITFMRTFDQMCETIAQGGARRGAQMGVMKVDHPDIIEFVHAKRKDVSLAQTLRLNDPDDFTHNSFAEALEEARELIDEEGRVPKYLRNAVEGHLSNFNISVGVTDEFFEAVQEDRTFTFKNPRTNEPWVANEETVKLYEMFGLGKYVSEGEILSLPARELWDHIIEGAHENGEPGVVHMDEFNRQHSFPIDLDKPFQDQEYAQLATNPCVTGDTKVATADGRGAVEIEKLVDEDEVPVYTRKNDEGDVGVELARNIRKTREDAELVEIETDGDVSLKCTEDHSIWTQNRGWVEAKNLQKGDSLHALWDVHHNGGYNAKQWTGNWDYNLEHRMVAKDILGVDIENHVIHHRDGDKKNNNPDNLSAYSDSKHKSKHLREDNPMDSVDFSGENNPMFGKSHSEETKRKIGNRDYKQRSEKISKTAKRQFEEGDDVECRVCGKSFKALNLHLRSHDMTAEQYKEKYGDDAPFTSQQIASNHKVKNIQSAGTGDVFNMIVRNTHNYYAGDTEDDFFNIKNCGEQPLMEGEACNLGHINLSTLVSETGLHNWKEFTDRYEFSDDELEEAVSEFLTTALDNLEFERRIDLGTHFLENVVTMSDFPVPEIDETVEHNRKIGLGIMGLAQLYVQLGVEYGSPVANEIAKQIMMRINHGSKLESHRLAQERGTFENWADSKYAAPTNYPEWFKHHTGEDPDEWENGFPIRNHNTTTIAPTGTTSMIGNTTGGCEPIYNVANYKNVSDDVQGDEMLIQFDSLFLKVLEENDIDVDSIKDEAELLMSQNKFEGIESLSVPQELSELFVTTSDLTAKEHAKVQLACQKGVDSAISKTVNAPNSATIDDTREAFELILEGGGKGVTYYRDGTRTKQVLTTRADNQDVDDDDSDEEKENGKTTREVALQYVDGLSDEEVIDQLDLNISETSVNASEQVSIPEPEVTIRERPRVLDGSTYRVETGYGKMYVIVNDANGKPFEVFGTIEKSGGFQESMLEGLCRMASASLRSGVPVQELIDQLEGIRSPRVAFEEGQQIRSIPDGIAKAFEQHISQKREQFVEGKTDGGEIEKNSIIGSENPLEKSNDGEPLSKNLVKQSSYLSEPCPDCSEMTLVRSEGCVSCNTCGWSKC